MKSEVAKQSSFPTQEIPITIPPTLAKRAETYALEHGTTITNVVIEALDAFLREQAKT